MSPRRRLPVLLLAALAVACACAAARPCAALVRLGAASFVDAPARFGPRVTGDGICGSLRAAEPADACAPVRGAPGGSGGMAFVLIARGNCSFEGKVRAAQRAGFDAALVHDDEDKASLYSMVGDPEGIHIPAVFVSKMAGETLKKFARGEDEFHVECIDPWLTQWGTFCPVCKLEVLTGE
ncbi:unnamed protein product [Triticum turgidum subsp. durum]|uniref:RING-type E3 ubiquitin transferase n=1 Tax=Triticum turgidum subsp. durum TaxID=4567 RepID=A0A9R1NI53_TRITD|nr:unnamed protein product [Triticum turgidum subsp. durum]